jgi:hypothetical protein
MFESPLESLFNYFEDKLKQIKELQTKGNAPYNEINKPNGK